MRLIDAGALLVAYAKEHKGPPGRAWDLILDAPTVCWLMNAAEDGPPTEKGWYLVYAPDYDGGCAKDRINGYMFAQWNGKTWSVERYVYQNKGCVKAWMALPDLTKGVVPGCGAKKEGEVG